MVVSPAEAVLKDREGKEIKGAELWSSGPALVIVLRRPGCLLCREQSLKLWAERERLEALGLRLVVVLHEWRELEVAAYAPAYWGGELYFDEAKAFYMAVHGGKIKRGRLIDLVNPFGNAWKNMQRAKKSGLVKESNLTGDGLTLGGLLVFKRGGALEYSYAESTFGDHAPLEEVLAAAERASKA